MIPPYVFDPRSRMTAIAGDDNSIAKRLATWVRVIGNQKDKRLTMFDESGNIAICVLVLI